MTVDTQLDDVNVQVLAELRQTVREALGQQRPVLHHLNADSSWLLQLPRPRWKTSKATDRHFFNILIDPWLAGGQSDVASWFSQQFHASESRVPNIVAVEKLCELSEVAVSNLSHSLHDNGSESLSHIDAVAISHEFTDHCHKETLLEVNPNVPVFATTNAAKLVQSWKHFQTVCTTPNFGGGQSDWTATSIPPLPEWLSISRVVTAGDALYYHSALLITYNNSGSLASQAECIIYTPHGIHSEDLQCIATASPPIRTLAFLHGLHDITLSKAQLNLGAHNGLEAQRLLRAKYWIGTHDEVKNGGGLVSWFLYRKAWTLEDALQQERDRILASEETSLGRNEKDVGKMLDDANWLTLENGESRVLL